ncbi:MAG: C40 family peptidase [Bacteroidales bacterium]|nr:C40 family peptidase [Bacteroidales bacterium]
MQSHKYLYIFYLIVFVLTICAKTHKDPIEELISQYKEEEEVVRKLKQFKEDGYEKKLNIGDNTSDDLIEIAKSYLGTPYKWSGTSKKGLDCSGLLFASFRDLGVGCPHSSQEIARYGQIIIEKDDLVPGDLLFFIGTYQSNIVLITHSAIYLSEKQFIHTSSKNGVEIQNMDTDYWKDKFLFGTRVFENN